MSAAAQESDARPDGGGYRNATMDEKIRAIVDRNTETYSTLTVRCGACDWRLTAASADALAALAAHRDEQHPGEWEAFQKKHRQRNNPITLQWPRERCVEFIARLTVELGRRPRIEDLTGPSTPDRPNFGLVAKQCGGWKRACDDAKARIETTDPPKKETPMAHPYTREQCVDAGMRWMRERGGQSPTAADWMQPAGVRGNFPSRDGVMGCGAWKTWTEFRAAVEDAYRLEQGAALCTQCGVRPQSKMPSTLFSGLCGQCRDRAAAAQTRLQPELDKLAEPEAAPPVVNGSSEDLGDVDFEELVRRAQKQQADLIAMRKEFERTQDALRNHPLLNEVP